MDVISGQVARAGHADFGPDDLVEEWRKAEADAASRNAQVRRPPATSPLRPALPLCPNRLRWLSLSPFVASPPQPLAVLLALRPFPSPCATALRPAPSRPASSQRHLHLLLRACQQVSDALQATLTAASQDEGPELRLGDSVTIIAGDAMGDVGKVKALADNGSVQVACRLVWGMVLGTGRLSRRVRKKDGCCPCWGC